MKSAMPRPSRSFTVEVKGRRKAVPFSWDSALAVVSPNPPSHPVFQPKRSQDPWPSAPDGSMIQPNRRILPDLLADERQRTEMPGVAKTKRSRRPPKQPRQITLDPLPGSPDLLVTKVVKAPISAEADEKVRREAPEPRASRRSKAALTTFRTRRSGAKLGPGERWKRRLPALLR